MRRRLRRARGATPQRPGRALGASAGSLQRPERARRSSKLAWQCRGVEGWDQDGGGMGWKAGSSNGRGAESAAELAAQRSAACKRGRMHTHSHPCSMYCVVCSVHCFDLPFCKPFCKRSTCCSVPAAVAAAWVGKGSGSLPCWDDSLPAPCSLRAGGDAAGPGRRCSLNYWASAVGCTF